MNAAMLLAALRHGGLEVWASDSNVMVRPASLLTPRLRELVLANKPALLAYLRRHPDLRGPFEQALRHGGMVVCSGCVHFEYRAQRAPDGWCSHFETEAWQLVPFFCSSHQPIPTRAPGPAGGTPTK